ncbi:MAG: DHA2 family efflux MFS transporter permease subunit [Alphaproteobacteria bacterium]|nr:DHA2 family efflux MFS transporter permease subunit [Alphaproteobacteria bacterium]
MSIEAGVLSSSGRRQAATALMIATAMQAFDTTIANVALPQLEESLGGGIELGSWVMTSYLCASAVMAILTGWLRRRYGARPLFVGSIALFIVASGLCSVAPSALALIQFRLLQGAAAGIIQPLAQAILLDIYPQQDHGRMLAIWGATIMAGPILGPVLGGVIADLTSWRWIFALNFPLGVIAILGLGHVPAAAESTTKAPIDGIGLVLLIIGIGSLQLALERRIGQSWPLSAETAAAAAVAVLALTAIAIRSVRAQFTLFRFQVFANLNFSAAAFYNFLIGALLFTTIVFLPALSEGPLGYDATQAGLALSPRGIGTMATMLAIHYLIDRIDHRVLLATGLAVTAGALVLMSWVPSDGGQIWLAAASGIQGIGVGLLFTPLSTLAFSTLRPELRTDGAGVYSLLRQLGCATGVAVMTTLLQARIQGNSLPVHEPALAGASSPSEALNYGLLAAYTGCFRTMAIITAITLPGVLLFRALRPDTVAPTAV